MTLRRSNNANEEMTMVSLAIFVICCRPDMEVMPIILANSLRQVDLEMNQDKTKIMLNIMIVSYATRNIVQEYIHLGRIVKSGLHNINKEVHRKFTL